MKKVTNYRLTIISLLFLAASFNMQAQNKGDALDTLRMTLDQCINYALKNNVNILNSTLDEEIAAARVREVRGVGLPQINGSVGLQHYFQLRNSYYASTNPFLTAFTAGSPGLKLPTSGNVIVPNIFQLPSTLDASVTASQILFNASYLVGLQAAKTYKDLSHKSVQQNKEQTSNNVRKAYYQQLISLERIKLFDVNISRLDTSIRQTKALQKNGFAEKIDVNRLEVSYNNLLTEYEKTLNLLLIASLQLKFQMGMPLEQNLILSDSINKFVVDNATIQQETNYKNRTDYQLLELQKVSNELDLKNNRSAALPSLNLSGTLGAFTQNSNMDFFSENSYKLTNFGKPTAAVAPTSIFSNYSFIQFSLNVPIFSGLQRTYKVQQSKLTLQKTQNNIRNFEKTANVQIQAAKVNLLNSYKTLDIQKRNLELAKEVSEVAYKKYKVGTGSNLEVTNAEASLKESQVNYFGALYDFLVNKVDFEQAAGLNSKY